MMQYDQKMGIQRWLIIFVLQFLLHLPTTRTGFACVNNPCIHGVCLDDLNSTYFCYCIDGYTGIQCQTNWNECWSSPCRNGGVCLDGIATFECTCPAGYTGRSCEEDINECESNPCQNNGTCIDAQNGYTCNCLPGYSGTYCEIDIAVCNSTNETRCFNGGMCEEGPGDSFWCQCPQGWGGFLCDTELDECASSPCQNGAVCIDLHAEYSCACLFGYTGQNCEEVMQICDSNPCRNGALCIIEENRSVCYCVPDFHGDLCQFQYDECQLGPKCMNGGTCIDGIDNSTCSCPPNLTGVLCECLILEDGTLDCTYVSSRPTGVPTSSIYYENYTIPITSPSTVKSTETTEVPTTIHSLFNETITSSFVTSTDISSPISSTSFMTLEESTIFVTAHAIPSTVSQTSTDISSYVTTPSITTTSLIFENSTITSEELKPTTQEFPTTYEVIELTSLDSKTTSEKTFTTASITMSPEEPITSVVSTEYTSTYSTSPEEPLHQNMSSSTKESSSSTLSIDYTTPAVLSSTSSIETVASGITLVTTSQEGRSSNDTLPEETTTSIHRFFTTEPTKKMEPSIMTSTILPTFDSTTMETTEETTTWTSIDCTKYETKCQNGGTCVFLESGYKCICHFDHEGPYCEVKLGIRHAAFNGNSFLSHHVLTSSYHIAIEFEAKTMANDGLLFYCNIDSPHIALYMESGYLKFRFSCGYQTMLLSELKIPVNNGFSMNIKAGLDFSKDFNHCNASIRVNDSLSMTGDQVAKIDRLHHPSTWLHLGGLPLDLSNDVSYPVGGLFGCISNLKIDNHRVRIYDDAEDGNAIMECSSLACLSNPCSNGGSCSSMGDKWQCHCRNGYLGKTCHISICDDNPCLYGGTCIPFTNSGYICLCPYGKHGHFCENDLKVTEPNFSSTIRGLSSFVAYPFPDGISKNMELTFRFIPTTMEQIALLLFIGQAGHHDFYSDHIAVSFVKGYIMLTWNLGSGPRRIFTAQPIKKKSASYLVKLGHTGRRAWLYVENVGNVTGRTPGTLIQLDVVPLLYIGGHESKNFSTLPHDLPLHTGFSGCIFEIEMKSGSVVIPFQGNMKSFGRSVGQCGTSECYERSCQNGGACLHHGSTFMCLCQDDWYSPLCSSNHNLCDSNYTKCSDDSRCVPLLSNYECDCPLGKTGNYCREVENITDVSLTGKRSYFALKPIEFDDSKFHIEFDIRVLKDRGVVLFIGRKDTNFISVSLLNQMIEIRIRSGGTKMNGPKIISVRSSKLLVKAFWHKVKFGIYGRKTYISVDNIINTGILDVGHVLTISKETVFFGGLPDLSDLPLSATSSLSEPFQGCLKHLSIDGKSVRLDSSSIKESRNMGDCAGTPCGGEACQNGGTCWLDSFMQPHCSCVSPFYGEKCEEVAICDAKSCKNRGKCLNNKCTCQVGYAGAFCESQIVVKTPQFGGKSYLRVKRGSDRKRNLKDNGITSIQLNFTTASPNGLLLWNDNKGNNTFGLGLENGFLKLALTIGKSKQTIVEVPSYVQLADGLWHHVEIMLDPFVLKIDGKDFLVYSKFEKTTRVKLIGDFFIGGMPANSSLILVTNGLFPQAFEGCISGFGTNVEYMSDFSLQEGSNITRCDFLAA
ncbi:unnamed protein product [Phaedon cochleariae]|uniref:Protein eyes shut n=1 Tax=Phaedon cochleariae TaxID=80249 RepID=A0A9N9SMD0_PHACE|nr:unnamed protein product [Phaedon cochleariae]